MIKVNELRIGNLIYAGTDENEMPQAGKVLQIFEDVIHWTFDAKQNGIADGYNSTDALFINPIPLTPEWLERCGVINNKIALKNERWYLECAGEGGFVLRDVMDESVIEIIADIQYVHQLQNLFFAFVGEELAINL